MTTVEDRRRRREATMAGDDAPRQRRFEAMFDDHFRLLLGYALRRVSDPAAAADVVADTFLVAWRRLDDVPGGDECRLWLYGTARKVLANHHRGERRRDALVARLGTHLSAVMPEPDDEAITVREALGRLDEDDAELLRLTSWEGLSPAELDGERSGRSGHVIADGRPPVRDPEEES